MWQVRRHFLLNGILGANLLVAHSVQAGSPESICHELPKQAKEAKVADEKASPKSKSACENIKKFIKSA